MIITKLIRSRRRSVALVVEQDATLTVRAPHRVSERYINELISKKRGWIEEKQHQMLSRGKAQEKKYVDGELFLFLGKEYALQLCYGKAIELVESNGVIMFPRKFLPRAQRAMISWYKTRACDVLKERVNMYSELTSWRHTSLKVTSAKTRWGSCSGKGALNFTWRLVMAPLAAVDYVVVHELAHINERNHSSRFWNAVASVLPMYEHQEKWLKDNGGLLRV